MTNDAVKVDTQDTLGAAINDALIRTNSVFGSNTKTLVDTISKKDWDNWDASNEKPNVADTLPLEEEVSDHDEQTAA